MIPDTSNDAQMALIGRQTLLRKARREAAGRLRDILVPLLNSIEQRGVSWDVSGIAPLVDEISAINAALDDLG